MNCSSEIISLLIARAIGRGSRKGDEVGSHRIITFIRSREMSSFPRFIPVATIEQCSEYFSLKIRVSHSIKAYFPSLPDA